MTHSLGTLSATHPVGRFLAREVMGAVLGVEEHGGGFEVQRLDEGGAVLGFTARTSGVRVVGKFFQRKVELDSKPLDPSRAAFLLMQEWDNLHRARALGLDQPPLRVVRPLATSLPLGAMLVQEHVTGRTLDDSVRAALFADQPERLAGDVTRLAHWLAALHRRSASEARVPLVGALGYAHKVTEQLWGAGILAEGERDRLRALVGEWVASGWLSGVSASLIHGDATPANLLLSDHEVVALDLERMRPDDPAVDLGCVTAELKHCFLRCTDDPWASEPTIRHFHASYRAARALDEAAFARLTRRVQFYMGIYLLRIARNAWHDLPYRRRLALEGSHCLYPS